MIRTSTGIAFGLAAALISAPALGDKPANVIEKSNGFPSGPHYNLNFNAKNSEFQCPPAQYDELGNQLYGNVIFMPREQGNDAVTVLMESGKKGPKSAPTTSTLEVTDWCTESFADDGGSGEGDAAMLRLPKNDAGYRVYARVLGKPGDGATAFTAVPDLVAVEDEFGNDLLYLGLVTDNGFESASGTLYRTDGGKGKSAPKATDITGLFEWSGEVCYVQPDAATLYCGDGLCQTEQLCCTDADGDGAYDSCDALASVGVDDGTGLLTCPITNEAGEVYLATTAECRSYTSEWVFNIGDFVTYLWDITNDGAYHVQVRFYPQQ